MHMTTHLILKAAARGCVAAAGLALACGAQAQNDYPNKPVRIVYPFAAGGGGDLVSRTLAAELARDLKESFIIDNRTGGNGNIGTDIVARATPPLRAPDVYVEGPERFGFSFYDIGLFLGFSGILLFTVRRFLSQHQTIPVKDPLLHETLHHHVY